jgi:hypothetical protein
MAILDYGSLVINGNVVSYEGAVKIEAGSKKRIVNPQVNGSKIITSDISTNVSKITITIRVTPSSNEQFDGFYQNGDNNTISYRDKNFSGCVLEMIPEREDLATVDYVFYGDPAL